MMNGVDVSSGCPEYAWFISEFRCHCVPRKLKFDGTNLPVVVEAFNHHNQWYDRYSDGGAGSLKFPPSENPCIAVGAPGWAAALPIEDGGLGAGADDCAPACCGETLGLAYSGRCVFFASTSTWRSRFDSWIPCD